MVEDGGKKLGEKFTRRPALPPASKTIGANFCIRGA